MKNQQEYKDLSLLYESIYEEGILSRAGARVAGAKAATGQYFKNIGSTVMGKAAPTGAGQAAAAAKTQYAFQAAAKNLLNDLQKLGLLPKGQIPAQAQNQIQNVLNDMVQNLQQQQPASQQQKSQQQTAQPEPIAAPEPATVPQQEPTPKLPQQQPEPAAAPNPKRKRTKKAKPVTDDKGFKQVSSSKIRKTYSQSDEELAPMPSSFEYFGS
jgi:hypothetical protein